MAIIGGLIAAGIFALFCIVFYGLRERDKRRRAEMGLPRKKYGDMTDWEVTRVHVIQYKRD